MFYRKNILFKAMFWSTCQCRMTSFLRKKHYLCLYLQLKNSKKKLRPTFGSPLKHRPLVVFLLCLPASTSSLAVFCLPVLFFSCRRSAPSFHRSLTSHRVARCCPSPSQVASIGSLALPLPPPPWLHAIYRNQ